MQLSDESDPPRVVVAGLKSFPLARRVIRTFAGMYTYVLMGDLLSSGVQVARHGHHRRFTGYALPTAGGLTCGDGQLVDFLRCVAVRVGRALLYQQFGDLFAIARRFRFRASRRAAACGLADRRDGYLSTRAL